MKALKIFKWIGIGLVMLVGIGLAFIYGRSHHLQHLTLDIPLQEISVPTDSAAIADGFK
ncbi:MAG: hypothetical protein R2825_10150 [Saprospiraceae bacterium]